MDARSLKVAPCRADERMFVARVDRQGRVRVAEGAPLEDLGLVPAAVGRPIDEAFRDQPALLEGTRRVLRDGVPSTATLGGDRPTVLRFEPRAGGDCLVLARTPTD